MDFEWADEQRELVGDPIGAGTCAAFPHESWTRRPTCGIRALPLPEACGGSG